MRKYALVMFGVVHSVFETEKQISEFPDIQDKLIDITGLDVHCNYLFDKNKMEFIKPEHLREKIEQPGFFRKLLNFITFK